MTLSEHAAAVAAAGGALASALERTMMSLCEISVAASETNEAAGESAAAVASLGEAQHQIAARAQAAIERTRGGVERAGESAEAFRALAAALDKVEQVSQAIQGIAKQTNLIALNATLEAARAGVAGRGFAVVAGEVKRLADATRELSRQISADITGIKTLSGHAQHAFAVIVEEVGAIDTDTQAIFAALREQDAASQSLSQQTQACLRRTEKMSSDITEVQMLVGDTWNAYTQLAQSAEALTAGVAQPQAEAA